MTEITEHRDGFYQSLTDLVHAEAEYVHLAVNPTKGDPTIEAGSLGALGHGLREDCQQAFRDAEILITDNTLTLFSVYVPGPAWDRGGD